ncbi:GlpG protein [Volucribacter psittacicida]|uniref:GlpG protein n=1 Tax=Volucribacter psittacicida TaxID=203482 RepID=A0A4V2PBV6_9PAST|nr:rhomboid family intramembrane serine protease [Volucribacter psittacicida]TCJ98855.1 GlpG protein [Volucribacter psittacicida]
MKLLLQSEIGALALHFRDYIRNKYGIELILEQTEQGDRLYIEEDNPYFADILQEREQFLQNPFDSRYEQASWQAGDIGFNVSQKKGGLFLVNFLWQYCPPFTLLISLVCIGLYLLSFFIGDEPIFLAMHYPAYSGEEWQLWRYISHSLVHLSLPHLLLNLTFWIYLGHIIEKNLGWWRLCVLYLSFALFSGIAQNWANGPAFFGLSGVVYGLMGYALVLDRFAKQSWFILPSGFTLMIIVGLISGFVAPWLGINVGNAAHISGLICGLIAGGITLFYQRLKATSME